MDEKVIAAANRFEELASILKEIVVEFRSGSTDPYATAYWFRREVSRVVATLGAGQPNTSQVQNRFNWFVNEK